MNLNKRLKIQMQGIYFLPKTLGTSKHSQQFIWYFLYLYLHEMCLIKVADAGSNLKLRHASFEVVILTLLCVYI